MGKWGLKHNHNFYGKTNIFSVKSTLLPVLPCGGEYLLALWILLPAGLELWFLWSWDPTLLKSIFDLVIWAERLDLLISCLLYWGWWTCSNSSKSAFELKLQKKKKKWKKKKKKNGTKMQGKFWKYIHDYIQVCADFTVVQVPKIWPIWVTFGQNSKFLSSRI